MSAHTVRSSVHPGSAGKFCTASCAWIKASLEYTSSWTDSVMPDLHCQKCQNGWNWKWELLPVWSIQANSIVCVIEWWCRPVTSKWGVAVAWGELCGRPSGTGIRTAVSLHTSCRDDGLASMLVSDWEGEHVMPAPSSLAVSRRALNSWRSSMLNPGASKTSQTILSSSPCDFSCEPVHIQFMSQKVVSFANGPQLGWEPLNMFWLRLRPGGGSTLAMWEPKSIWAGCCRYDISASVQESFTSSIWDITRYSWYNPKVLSGVRIVVVLTLVCGKLDSGWWLCGAGAVTVFLACSNEACGRLSKIFHVGRFRHWPCPKATVPSARGLSSACGLAMPLGPNDISSSVKSGGVNSGTGCHRQLSKVVYSECQNKYLSWPCCIKEILQVAPFASLPLCTSFSKAWERSFFVSEEGAFVLMYSKAMGVIEYVWAWRNAVEHHRESKCLA